ncbi:MAG: hypothetical protein WDZ53_04840 [Balneolales bacterium]
MELKLKKEGDAKLIDIGFHQPGKYPVLESIQPGHVIGSWTGTSFIITFSTE